jgi:hypothetical protein
MASFDVLAIVVSILGLTASITYYAIVLSNSNKARQAQLYTQIWKEFSSQDYFQKYYEFSNREWESVDEWFEKYGGIRQSNPEEYARMASLAAYYEGIGILLRNGFIDIKPVADLLGSTILNYWDRIEPLAKEMRLRQNNPRFYLYTEYLYNRVKPVIQKEHLEINLEEMRF